MHPRRARERGADHARSCAAASAYGPGGHSRRDARVEPRQLRGGQDLGRGPSRRSTASSHGTMICCGGRPSTDSEMSDGAAPASSATIGDDRRSQRLRRGAEQPHSRNARARSTPRSTRLACAAPAQTIGASWLRPATRLTSARPASSFHSVPGDAARSATQHHRRANDRGDIGGAGQRGVIPIDGRRLRDVERLAGRDVGQVVDDDDAADEIGGGELARQRAADLAGAEDHRRATAVFYRSPRRFITTVHNEGSMSRVN